MSNAKLTAATPGTKISNCSFYVKCVSKYMHVSNELHCNNVQVLTLHTTQNRYGFVTLNVLSCWFRFVAEKYRVVIPVDLYFY